MTTPTDVRPAEPSPGPRARDGPVPAGAFQARQLWAAAPDALRKLDPRTQLRNPVMFVVWVGSVLVTISAILQPSCSPG